MPLKRWFRPIGRMAVAVLVTFGVVTSVSGHTAELTPVRLRLDWVWQAPQAIWTLANERGYFKDEGLSVTIDRGYGGLENAAALASGNYDIMFGDINSVILFNAKSAEHKLISVFVIYDAYPGAVIVRKGSGITKPKDLEGKTIGAPLTTGGRTLSPASAAPQGRGGSKGTSQRLRSKIAEQQWIAV